MKETHSGIVEVPCRKISASTTKLRGFQWFTEGPTFRAEDFKWDPDADDPKFVELMVHYFYHLDYLESETAKLKGQTRRDEDLDTGILIDHASMYAMGDKYDIPGLRDLAVTKYREAYERTNAGFASSIVVAWTSTIDSDMGLRNVILKILNKNTVNLMSMSSINQSVRYLPSLSHALLQMKLPRTKSPKAIIPGAPYMPEIPAKRLTMRERIIIDNLKSPPSPSKWSISLDK